MAHHPTSGRDSSPPEPSGASEVSSPADDNSIVQAKMQSGVESNARDFAGIDLTELRAKFAASGGPGLSGELSSDLALEIVLHEIVEQACMATGATGAAIVLERDGEMVCRASSGPTAPELGARLDAGSGLSGECVRTRQVQRCEDAWNDPRADGEASRRLGVRSVMVFPLLREEKVRGIFEALSSQAAAFGESDERILERLAERILKNIERAAQPLVKLENAERREQAAVSEFGDAPVATPTHRGLDIATWALAVIVLMCAVWVGARVVQHFAVQQTGVRSVPQDAKTVTSGSEPKTEMMKAPDAAPVAERAKDTSSGGVAGKSSVSAPEGSLLVYENGREVFRMPPEGSEKQAGRPNEKGVRRAASVEAAESIGELPAVTAEKGLIHRVEPEYPELARQEGVEGAVVLELRIRPDGEVEDLKVVSGPPALAVAAVAAVKQWKFRPQPRAMQTTITIDFRLPR